MFDEERFNSHLPKCSTVSRVSSCFGFVINVSICVVNIRSVWPLLKKKKKKKKRFHSHGVGNLPHVVHIWSERKS